jgi:hypothetical protein
MRFAYTEFFLLDAFRHLSYIWIGEFLDVNRGAIALL